MASFTYASGPEIIDLHTSFKPERNVYTGGSSPDQSIDPFLNDFGLKCLDKKKMIHDNFIKRHQLSTSFVKIYKIPLRHFQSIYKISRFVSRLSYGSLKLLWLVYDCIGSIVIQSLYYKHLL